MRLQLSGLVNTDDYVEAINSLGSLTASIKYIKNRLEKDGENTVLVKTLTNMLQEVSILESIVDNVSLLG